MLPRFRKLHRLVIVLLFQTRIHLVSFPTKPEVYVTVLLGITRVARINNHDVGLWLNSRSDAGSKGHGVTRGVSKTIRLSSPLLRPDMHTLLIPIAYTRRFVLNPAWPVKQRAACVPCPQMSATTAGALDQWAIALAPRLPL